MSEITVDTYCEKMVDRMVGIYTDRYLGLMSNWEVHQCWKATMLDGVDKQGRNTMVTQRKEKNRRNTTLTTVESYMHTSGKKRYSKVTWQKPKRCYGYYRKSGKKGQNREEQETAKRPKGRIKRHKQRTTGWRATGKQEEEDAQEHRVSGRETQGRNIAPSQYPAQRMEWRMHRSPQKRAH